MEHIKKSISTGHDVISSGFMKIYYYVSEDIIIK